MQQSQVKPPIIVTDKLVNGMFMAVDRVTPDKSGGFRVTGHPTADSGVRKVTATVDADRARELGLVA